MDTDIRIKLSVEVMVTIATLKSFIAWIWTWVINDWVDDEGMLTAYMVIAAVNVVGFLTTVALYIWGKRIRTWLQKADLLGWSDTHV